MVRELSTPTDEVQAQLCISKFNGIAATSAGRQALVASHALEAMIGMLEQLAADSTATAPTVVAFLDSITALVSDGGVNREIACDTCAERATRSVLATWDSHDAVGDAAGRLLVALAFEDADSGAVDALPPSATVGVLRGTGRRHSRRTPRRRSTSRAVAAVQ